MSIIKSFTSLEQSKKLAEILPIESADMWWSRCTVTDFGDGVLKVSYAVEPCNISQFRNTKEDVRCWSLAALYNILPNSEYITTTLSRGGWKVKNPVEFIDGWYCEYEDGNNPENDITVLADNPVDACVEMIIKLHELNLL